MTPGTTRINLEIIVPSSRKQTRDRVWCESMSMKCPEKQIYRDRKLSSCQWLGGDAWGEGEC